MVEGTPLLREHGVKNSIEGSNPSVSAKDIWQVLEMDEQKTASSEAVFYSTHPSTHPSLALTIPDVC